MFNIAYYILWLAGATTSASVYFGLADDSYTKPRTQIAISLIPIIITLLLTALFKGASFNGN
jgi:hypothetical protein